MNSIFWKTSIYLIVTLIVTSIIALLQQRIFQISKLEILNFEKLEGAPIILPQLAPAISLLILILLIKSLKPSLNFDFTSLTALKSLMAIAIPLVLASIIFISSLFLGLKPQLTTDTMPAISLGLVTILIGAFGEEIGWRSFLQPLLEKKSSALFASILVGLFWGLWHVGHYKNGALYMIAFLLFTISASIIIAWIYRDTKFNILISTLFHTSINFGFFILFKHSLADFKFMAITAIVWMIPATCIVIITGRDLVRS